MAIRCRGKKKSLQLHENNYKATLPKNWREKVELRNSPYESQSVYFYIKIKTIRCSDIVLNNREGHMKEVPAPWPLHLPGAGWVQRACVCSRTDRLTKTPVGRLHCTGTWASFHGPCCFGSTAKPRAALAPLPACWLGFARTSAWAGQCSGRYAAGCMLYL